MGNVQWWINLYARTRTWIVAEDEDGVEFCLGHVRQFHGTDSTAVPADDANGGLAGTDGQGAALRAAGEWSRSFLRSSTPLTSPVLSLGVPRGVVLNSITLGPPGNGHTNTVVTSWTAGDSYRMLIQ